jgi:hypothetical protein
MPESEDKKTLDALVSVFQDPAIPHYYVNGFKNVLGIGDVAIAFEQNARTVLTLNMSHIIAKTLSAQLRELLLTIEAALDQPVPTSAEVEAKLRAKNITPVGRKQ